MVARVKKAPELPRLVFVTSSHNLSPVQAEVLQVPNIPELVTKRHDLRLGMLFIKEHMATWTTVSRR
jgi:hypothetical protein